MTDSKNIMSQISLKTKEVCYQCNQEKNNLSTFSICSHKICNQCLYWRLFSNHINELQGQKKIKIKCKCEKGYLYKELQDISKILKEKKDYDESVLYRKKNNIKIEITEECSSAFDLSLLKGRINPLLNFDFLYVVLFKFFFLLIFSSLFIFSYSSPLI